MNVQNHSQSRRSSVFNHVINDAEKLRIDREVPRGAGVMMPANRDADVIEARGLHARIIALLVTILVTELLRQAQIVAAPTFEFFALYGTAAAYYWVICLVLSFGQSRLERRLERYVAR